MALSLIVVGVAISAWRTFQLEHKELAHESAIRSLAALADAPGATGVSARLTTVALHEGELAIFEVCSQDALDPSRWRGALEWVVWGLPDMRVMLRIPLNDAYLAAVKRNPTGACLPLGSGIIDRAGDYAVDAVWPDGAPPDTVRQVGLRARVLGRTPLSWERLLILGIALAGLIMLVAELARRRFDTLDAADGPQPSHAARVLTVGVIAAVSLGAAVVLTPFGGSTSGLLKAMALAALEVGLALALAVWLHPLARPSTTLALHPSRRPLGLSIYVAIAAAGLLVVAAKLSLAVIPSTREAPIQTFVSWPSGMLAFATIGVVVPIAEEIFFRGFVYQSAARAFGIPLAFVITLVLFLAIHAHQTWGGWGGLAAIAVVGVALTGLRVWSGSALVPALTHLAYNLSLTYSSLQS